MTGQKHAAAYALAVADRHILLITSANLTQSGVFSYIEAGLLIRGGTAPVRAAEHVDALRANGDLIRPTCAGARGSHPAAGHLDSLWGGQWEDR